MPPCSKEFLDCSGRFQSDSLCMKQARRPISSNIVPATKAESPIARPVVERRPVRDREIEKDNSSAVGSSKSKGMTCSFCGKVFSHAPAHLQHERAHLQQQATKNP